MKVEQSIVDLFKQLPQQVIVKVDRDESMNLYLNDVYDGILLYEVRHSKSLSFIEVNTAKSELYFTK